MAHWVKKGAYSVTMGTSELGLVAFACNPLTTGRDTKTGASWGARWQVSLATTGWEEGEEEER